MDGIKLCGRVRTWELHSNLCPDNDAEFRRWWPRLQPRAVLLGQRRNKIVNAGLTSIAQMIAGVASGATSGKVYQQAVGTRSGATTAGQTLLAGELYRKAVTATYAQSGPILRALTYFSPSEFWCAATTIAGIGTSGGETLLVQSTAGFRAGDRVRVPTATGYELHNCTSVGTSFGTPALFFATEGDQWPETIAGGATVEQVIAEAGLFGDEAIATPPAGTASFTQGDALVGGTQTAWSSAMAGTSIRSATPWNASAVPAVQGAAGAWLTIAEVSGSDLLVLTAGAPASYSGSYALSGTMFNRVVGLDYIKTNAVGYVLENDWSFTG